MELKIKPHTILMAVGVTQSGKTTYLKNVVIPQLEAQGLSVGYISSDDLRAELLGFDTETVDKESGQMLEVSNAAFSLFEAKIRAYGTFPVNKEVIILDTKGLGEEYRNDMINLAKELHYNIDALVFNFKTRSDFYKDINVSKRNLEANLTRFRQKVLRDLSLKKYNRVHVIPSKTWLENPEEFKVTVQGLDYYKSHFLPNEYDYLIVGDVHECKDELKSLLEKSGFIFENDVIVKHSKYENKRILFVGDYLDKGNNTKEILEFLTINKKWCKFVIGNHENFVYKVLTGEVSEEKVTERKLYYFSSIPLLQEDEYLRQLFFDLYEESRHFYIFKHDFLTSYYVTHAPCSKKYIGKTDAISLKEQCNVSIDYKDEGKLPLKEIFESQLAHLKTESAMNEPFHIFGHVALGKELRLNSRLGIDTGCVFGNRLTAVSIAKNKTYFVSVPSTKERGEVEVPIIFDEPKKVRLDDLERHELNRLKYATYNGINYVSGTMSPSDKDEANNVLESLDKGLDYFRQENVDKVMLQPKYMGSRCQIYLHEDVEKSYAVSRNGFKIRTTEKVDENGSHTTLNLMPIFTALYQKHGKFMDDNRVKVMVLDGELMPWATLGKGLIEDSFRPMEVLVQNELDLMKQYGFDAHYKELQGKLEASAFKEERNQMPKSELAQKYGTRDYDSFKALMDYVYTPSDALEGLLSVFKEQVDIFGQLDKEPFYEAFNILKLVHEDGSETYLQDLLQTDEIFTMISDAEHLVVDVNSKEDIEKAHVFFDKLTKEQKLEGVVIKPLKEKENVLPYMKVRNPRYLTLVYGYDYTVPHKYNRLMAQKSVAGKMKKSLKEHRLTQALLNIPMNEISMDNATFINILAKLILEIREESKLDPRL